MGNELAFQVDKEQYRPKYLRGVVAGLATAAMLAPQLISSGQEVDGPQNADYITVQEGFDPTDLENVTYPGWNECEFKPSVGSNNHCRSFYPEASVHFGLDVSAINEDCVYTGEIDWGDGTTTEYTVDASEYSEIDPLQAHAVEIGSHMYGEPGRYSINTKDTNTENSCLQLEKHYLFDNFQPPTPSDCENKFHPDYGRTYMYSMLPKGELKRANGQQLDNFNYIESEDGKPNPNVFVDEAGVRWNLLSPGESEFHQPINYDNDDDQSPYKKFTTDPDSRNGTFEAVLMPDGFGVDEQGLETYDGQELTYKDDNWLTRGHGLPTYNYASHNVSWWGHVSQDVLGHVDDQLSPFSDFERADDRYTLTEFWLPEGADWFTYRQRFEEAQDWVDQGAEYTATGDGATLTLNGQTLHIEPDLNKLVSEFVDCRQGAPD